MTRCDCCDLPVESCGKSLEQQQRAAARAERPPHGATTAARFPGRCPYGNEPIKVGDPLEYDEEYGWVCPDCVQALAD
jgi:hypothetical protein